MEKTLFEQALEIITKEVSETKFVESAGNTGISWFEGKTRLVKLVRTKKNITLEINMELSPELEKLDGMDKIAYATAHKKHLGTMKYLFRTNDIKNISGIIQSCLTTHENTKNQENKEK